MVQGHADLQPAVAVLAPFVDVQREHGVAHLFLVEPEGRLPRERQQHVGVIAAVGRSARLDGAGRDQLLGRHDGAEAQVQVVEVELAKPTIGLTAVRVYRGWHGNLLAGAEQLDFPVALFDLALLLVVEHHLPALAARELARGECRVRQDVKVPTGATRAGLDHRVGVDVREQFVQCLQGLVRVFVTPDVHVDDVKVQVADLRVLTEPHADVEIVTIGALKFGDGLHRSGGPLVSNGRL
ncbi:hypothetical protein D3C72_685760 [compost metagenome]